MLLKNIPLTNSDFEELEWEESLKDCEHSECYSYSPLFFIKAQEAEAAGNVKVAEAFNLLGSVTSMRLKPDSLTEPFVPTILKTDSRSYSIDDISGEHLNVLGEIVHGISNPEIRARVADILWVKKRDFRMAELAIKSLLASSTILEDPHNWIKCAERIERAFRLGASLGKNAGQIDPVISHIDNVIEKYNDKDSKYLSKKLMELLLEQKTGSGKKYSKCCENLAKQAELDGDWGRSRTYWETKARWHVLDKDEINERNAREQAAETYVKEAEATLESEQPRYMLASAHLKHAIEAYRKIGGFGEKIKEIHSLLLEYQEKSTKELKAASSEINLDDYAKEAITRVKGKTLYDAIIELALIVSTPEVNNLREQVQTLVKEYPIQHLFQTVSVDERGKVTGRMPNINSDDPEEVEKAFRAKMFQHSSYHHTITAHRIIEPARHQINLEHNVRLSDFIPIVSNNPLIPPGREIIYAQGLHAGMEGDFLVAVHLLIPQLEYSIRYVLAQHGVTTSGINSKGVQDEHSLNTTLYLPKIQEIFGEDITFDLQGLLVERFGNNLRNRMAHGLMAHDTFYSDQVLYLWGLILRLCCLPIIMQIQNNEGEPS